MEERARTHWLHELFEIGIVLKGINGALELIGGTILLFVSSAKISAFLYFITAGEVADDPTDPFSHFLRSTASHYSAGSQHFLEFYLLSHGVMKVFLSYALYKEKVWAFPAALSIFSLFVLYEGYRFLHTHSPFLLAAIVFDLVVIGLIWNEYRRRSTVVAPVAY
jgi:uncharacterized membrane protein